VRLFAVDRSPQVRHNLTPLKPCDQSGSNRCSAEPADRTAQRRRAAMVCGAEREHHQQRDCKHGNMQQQPIGEPLARPDRGLREEHDCFQIAEPPQYSPFDHRPEQCRHRGDHNGRDRPVARRGKRPDCYRTRDKQAKRDHRKIRLSRQQALRRAHHSQNLEPDELHSGQLGEQGAFFMPPIVRARGGHCKALYGESGFPRLVRFRDINDPKTVEKVDPTNLPASFGPGYGLKARNSVSPVGVITALERDTEYDVPICRPVMPAESNRTLPDQLLSPNPNFAGTNKPPAT
jgi:hypothetical protein